VGGDWGVCDPHEPKNRRTRCSLLIEQWTGEVEPADKDKTIILVDTSPDLREQLLAAQIKHVDAVLYTHDHADQSHGIDDLRALAYRMRSRIPVYMDDTTKDGLLTRFGYCFEMPEGRIHPPIFDLQNTFKSKDKLQINGPGGLKYNRSPAHVNVDKTLMWQAYTQVPNFILTNLHIDMDYKILSAELMGQQTVGYDGQEILV